ncbi:MAG: archease [Chromatiales bacterium]
MASGRWEHFSHVADLGVRGVGASVEEAFAQAAKGLTAAVTDPENVLAAAAVDIECRALDIEVLFNDWLNKLVYEMATRRMLFTRFDVRIDGGAADTNCGLALRAVAWGEPVDRERHQPAVEVKGATYSELKVARNEDGSWLAQCVVDV